MLTNLFLHILNMSITASIAILAVFLLRCFLSKLPKVFSYVLWGVVLFRLLCPISFSSPASLMNLLGTPVGQDGTIHYVSDTSLSNGTIDNTENIQPSDNNNIIVTDNSTDTLSEGEKGAAVSPVNSRSFSNAILDIAAWIWFVGIFVLLAYTTATSITLYRKVHSASHLQDNIYVCEDIDTAFVMGVVKPRIYLPVDLEDTGIQYITCHEQTHIRRKDHIVKLFAFFALCLHWFNPLVWAAFFASTKDMEMSCDEAVIRQLGNQVKKDYASYLLSLSSGRKLISPSPLAFGEDTRNRVKNVLRYKKPAAVITILVLLVCGIGAVCLISNPLGEKDSGEDTEVTSQDMEDTGQTSPDTEDAVTTAENEEEPAATSKSRVILCAAEIDRTMQAVRTTYLIEGDYESMDDVDRAVNLHGTTVPHSSVAHQTVAVRGETVTGIMVDCTIIDYPDESVIEKYSEKEKQFAEEYFCEKADSFSVTEASFRSFTVDVEGYPVIVQINPFAISIEGEAGWMQERTFYRFCAVMKNGDEKKIFLLPLGRTGKKAEKDFLENFENLENYKELPDFVDIQLGMEVLDNEIAVGAKFMTGEDIDLDTVSEITVYEFSY